MAELPKQPSRSISTPQLRDAATNNNKRKRSCTSTSAALIIQEPSDDEDPIANAAYTPISTYVRRKTPFASPTSPSFDSGYETSASALHTPLSVPTLPVLIANSASSDTDPAVLSDSDNQLEKAQDYYRFIHLRRTGTRISAARAARREQIARRYARPN